jgi:hypothetical protein
MLGARGPLPALSQYKNEGKSGNKVCSRCVSVSCYATFKLVSRAGTLWCVQSRLLIFFMDSMAS